MSPFVIYAMLHRKSKSGYIGQTGELVNRSKEHFGKDSSAMKKRNWLYYHARRDGVEMRILSYAESRQEAEEKECYWILRAQRAGWTLFNTTGTPDSGKNLSHLESLSPN